MSCYEGYCTITSKDAQGRTRWRHRQKKVRRFGRRSASKIAKELLRLGTAVRRIRKDDSTVGKFLEIAAVAALSRRLLSQKDTTREEKS